MTPRGEAMREAHEDSGVLLVTGATGYVGGRLVPRLLERGRSVRVLVRDPDRLAGRSWRGTVEVVQADVLEPDSIEAALEGVSAAYYLVHSMKSGGAFHERDQAAARGFGAAARQAGVGRILYLGGLGDPDADLSPHLRSRQETGASLGASGVPVTEFRAAVIVGSGSVSFEMIRYLTERLPVMVCPRWVYTRAQPIAVGDVLDYLVAALDVPGSRGRVIEIGGSDVLTYGDMMLGYARARGLRRALVPVPVLTPRLSSYWVHWVTPIPASIARPLIEGLRNEVVVRDDAARSMFPAIRPLNYEQAVASALSSLDAGAIETTWSDALAATLGDVRPARLTTEQGMIIERRDIAVRAAPARVFEAFTGLGGARGWLAYDWAWRLRGIADRLVGGAGFRRGRRDPDHLRAGDAIDFWRVEAVERDRLLRLRAEMRVPGRAWLQFETAPASVHPAHARGPGSAGQPPARDEHVGGDGVDSARQSVLVQTAYFAPKGLFGLVYWYALYPIHARIFSTLVERVGERAESLESGPG